MTTSQIAMDSPIGTLYLTASAQGLRSIHWKAGADWQCGQAESSSGEINAILKQAVSELREYFAGTRTEFNVPLDLQGTEFQRQVWGELIHIPFGSTQSYGGIARRLNNPKAVRAVGSANGRNPIPIVVPCHRVIASDGSLGGYAGGLKMKAQLLKLEGVLS